MAIFPKRGPTRSFGQSSCEALEINAGSGKGSRPKTLGSLCASASPSGRAGALVFTLEAETRRRGNKALIRSCLLSASPPRPKPSEPLTDIICAEWPEESF